MSFKLKSELSEKQIEADIATYFGYVTPPGQSPPFRLLDINEQVTGADKVYDQVIPIYMQFKVSEGLKGMTLPYILPQSLVRSPLQRIRMFRYKQQLLDNPTLYFKLRRKAETAVDFQHNILLKLRSHSNAHCFYVAPLTLSLNEYERLFFSLPDRPLSTPFYTQNITEIRQTQWSSFFGFVPFLRAHISIIPHERVNSDNHYYSFSPNGADIAWHSPYLITKYPKRLSDQMGNIFLQAFNNKYHWTSPRDLIKNLIDNIGIPIDEFTNDPSDDANYVELLTVFGRRLYEMFEIRQQLLLSTSKFVYEQIK
jgi:hypothetical protein